MTADQTTSTDATSIPLAAVVAAADALAVAVEIGRAGGSTEHWPSGPDITVLVAGVHGARVDGGLLLAVDAETAGRVASDPDRLADAFRRSLDELVAATGLALELGELGTTDATPSSIVELRDDDGIVAHFAVELEASAAAPESPGAPVAADFEPAPLAANGTVATPSTSPLTLLHDVEMNVTVELGRTTMPIRDLLALQPGMVVEIDRAAGAPIDVLVNGRLIACGEVVVIDEEFGIRITEIVATGAAM